MTNETGSREWLQHFPPAWRASVNKMFAQRVSNGRSDVGICLDVLEVLSEKSPFDAEEGGVNRYEVRHWMAEDSAGALALARCVRNTGEPGEEG
jgi:hypothetical protein